jgi:succinate dehydrogenase / fumarate reductase membrane anchor subunit
MHHDNLRSPLSRVRGLGSAKSGFSHWWWQRLTAVALIPLSIWLMVSFLTKLLGATRLQLAGWLESPVTALLLIAFLVAMFSHAKLGVQAILEDYMHSHRVKLVALILLQFICIALAAASVMAVIKLHFFGI